MFLKSLTLKGFKSFAEATTMDLEPGVTVVVGPNGSGKSNVVDAIAWVLGAQAPSAVRSQKMDDVIFAGTATRPALGRAEVSLTIDNSAGLLGIGFSELSVRRTLFRTGDSEYAINNVPCRLLDVQDLLSDAGIGRQQHVIVSQGQIDAVLNARPEERRGIVEEAAGVLKYRKRKEKAERRLDATEATLLRVQDLLREVRRQLRPLERQAEAARRHGELIGELTALKVHVAGRQIAALRTRLTALAAARIDGTDGERRLKSELARLDTDVAAAAAELTARGADDVGERLARVEQLREGARGLSALIAERRRGVERDRAYARDAGLVASLEGDAARYRRDLAVLEVELAASAQDLEALALDERRLGITRAGGDDDLDEGAVVDRTASAMAEVRGELRSRRAAVEWADAELVRAAQRAGTLDARLVELDVRIGRARHDCQAAELVETPLVAAIATATSRRDDAQAALDVAAADRQVAASAASAATARVEALQLALDAVHARAGAQRLAGADGVLGTLLDLIRVDAGWEPAVEAALGEAVGAIVVADPAAAIRAIRVLRASDTEGAVLALGLTASAAADLPDVGEAVRPHVGSDRRGVVELLDRLLAAAVRIDDLSVALDTAVRHPAAIVVTPSGDRLGTFGWRVSAAASGGVTAAALSDAEAATDRADRRLTAATTAEDAARATLSDARRHLDDLTARLAANDAVVTAAAEALAAGESDRREAQAELDPLSVRIEELRAHLAAEAERIAELQRVLPELEAGQLAAAEAVRARHAAAAALDAEAAVLAGRRRDLDLRSAALGERAQLLRSRLDETEGRLAAAAGERASAESRRVEVERSLTALDALGRLVEAHRSVADAHLGELVEHRRHQTQQVRELSDHLEALRVERAAAERSLDETRERSRRAEVDEAEARLRLESAIELLRHDLDVEPATAEAAPAPPLPDGVSAEGRVRELDREVRLLGPINPLALEEFTELQQRHAFLEEQLEDVRATRRDLGRVIKAVDLEIQTVFGAAFADVSTNFTSLFSTLFPGGSGRLVLTEPDDLLNTGVEVEAKPGGKNVKKLSLLSGGERSLTALAFLFAVFRSRPSPFYVMDEVEAALDDVNLHRFLGLVAEFRGEAQLLVVSHQKRTMEAGDSLLGVTMQPGGSSKVIAERVVQPV